MQKLMRMMHKNEKGFTLVELMVVVVIIGILVAIAIPVYQSVTANANRNTVEANLRTIGGAIQMHGAEEGSFPTSADGSDLVDEYLAQWPTGPDGVTYELDISGDTPVATFDNTDAGDWADAGEGGGNSDRLPVDWDND